MACSMAGIAAVGSRGLRPSFFRSGTEVHTLLCMAAGGNQRWPLQVLWLPGWCCGVCGYALGPAWRLDEALHTASSNVNGTVSARCKHAQVGGLLHTVGPFVA